jgi:beta-phosphoglucomutase-like phosphatase (HAD superfamily)
VSPELIIFDCDGVLIDSETIACRTDSACLAEIGIAMSAERIMDRYLGISADTMCADIELRLGRALPADFAETLRLRVAAAFEAEYMLMVGVEAFGCVASAPLRRVKQRARAAAPFAVAGGPAVPVEPHVFPPARATARPPDESTTWPSRIHLPQPDATEQPNEVRQLMLSSVAST